MHLVFEYVDKITGCINLRIKVIVTSDRKQDPIQFLFFILPFLLKHRDVLFPTETSITQFFFHCNFPPMFIIGLYLSNIYFNFIRVKCLALLPAISLSTSTRAYIIP